MTRNGNWNAWDPKEDDYLRENYPKVAHVKDLQNGLDRTLPSIYARARIIKVSRPGYHPRPRSQYTQCDLIEDVDWKIYYLRNEENLNATEIGERLGGLSKTQIHNRMHTRSLYYSPPAGDAPDWYLKGEIEF